MKRAHGVLKEKVLYILQQLKGQEVSVKDIVQFLEDHDEGAVVRVIYDLIKQGIVNINEYNYLFLSPKYLTIIKKML